ncbi:MAG TPA: proton-conducting transporter membrane subunit, partial [Solirubrobacteraceae bacterium]|nr:proton-conducting transporter membrane subunit [Solirubrobacteraceae bacterium]
MSASPAEVVAVAGAAAIALGAVVALLPRALRAGLLVQAAGIAALGVVGAVALLGHERLGAAFRWSVSPALGVDGLSGLFLALLAVTALPALVFALGYLSDDGRGRVLGALTGAFLLALAGVLVARDPSTLLGAWELMTVVSAAAVLVARAGGDDVTGREAAFLYLAITHVGGAGAWVALLTLGPGHAAAPAVIAVAALVGFGTKAGLVPMHAWLPRAHPVAPAHLSALMSGVMVKVALYGLIRVDFEWLGTPPTWLGIVLLAIGAASAVGGILWGLVQRDLKRLLAYCTIENVGIVVLALGASALLRAGGDRQWAAIAFGAALLHGCNLAVVKALLFLCAGAVEQRAGTLDLDRLGGLLRRMPWTGGALLLGAAAIAGVPGLNGFASEWLALQSLVHVALDGPLGTGIAGALALAALATAAGLALLTFVKVCGLALLGVPRTEAGARATEAPLPMRAATATLAALCVALGLAPGLLLPTLAGLAPGGGAHGLARHAGLGVGGTSLPTVALVAGIVVLTALLVRARGARRARPAPAWACGQPDVAAL